MWQLLIPAITQILDKVIPDPAQAASAKLQALQMAQAGELAMLDADLKLALGQLNVNAEEAKSGGFKANWRPLIGYVCAGALAWHYILNPIAVWAMAIWLPGMKPPLIELDASLWELMFGMLGLGGMRSWEKIKGRA